MRFTPKSEEEVQADELCPIGKQPFTVLECVEAKSKKNQDMLKLKLNVHAEDGFDYHVYDYISMEFMAFKFRHFFFCIGQGEAYESGTIEASKMVGREGYADVAHQKGKGEYAGTLKAVISDYVVENEHNQADPPTPAPKVKAKASKVAPDGAVAAPDDDDVPFMSILKCTSLFRWATA